MGAQHATEATRPGASAIVAANPDAVLPASLAALASAAKGATAG